MAKPPKKLLPYSKQFMPVGGEFGLIAFGPNSWDEKSNVQGRGVVLPPFEPPALYDWRIFRGLMVIAMAHGNVQDDYYMQIALHVLLAGAEMIDIVLPPRPLIHNGVQLSDIERPIIRYRRD